MRVALLFIDGVGIGRPDPEVNPLARGNFLLSQFDDQSGEPLGGGRCFSVDATFGLPGRPQSATNQAALLTGDPAPTLAGSHVPGFPNEFLRGLIARRSIVKRMVEGGRVATFANCYPTGYLDALGLNHRPSLRSDFPFPPRAVRKLRPSATTVAISAAGVPLRTFDDAWREEGLTHDITGSKSVARGFDVPSRNPEQAALIFWKLAAQADFTLFEHYLADKAGHAQDWKAALDALQTFDQFARAVVAGRPSDAALLICSDHGNVEDLSRRIHTRNPVPVLYFGEKGVAPGALQTVADVGRLILRLAKVEP